MSYYKLLGLQREPFSTSPDPDFFYSADSHYSALMRLMIEVRLRRGLSVIVGDIGSGKTTLSRKLFQMMHERNDIVFHMILDPIFDTEELFLDSLLRTLEIPLKKLQPTVLDFKAAIKTHIFDLGVNQQKTLVLLIDEAQKLSPGSLEILRVLLNYETNEYKLLQVILLGQTELLTNLRNLPNLWDRISYKQMLYPLSNQETKAMIDFRLQRAGAARELLFFTEQALDDIYQYSQGYPRKISMLCHNSLKNLIMQQKMVVDQALVKDLISLEVK